MSLRRNLQLIDRKLQGAVLIMCLPLRKDFARKPAYWVEIYRKTLIPAGKAQYFTARQWGFPKDRDVVQDHSVSYPSDLMRSLAKVDNIFEKKVASGWIPVTPGENYDGPLPAATDDEQDKISTYFAMRFSKRSKAAEAVAKRYLTTSEKFELSQKRRRAKAEW